MKSLYLLGAVLLLSACAPTAVRPPPETPTAPAPEPAPAPEAVGRPANVDASQPLGSRADVQAFIREMATRYGYNAALLRAVFARAYAKPAIIAAMSRQAEAKPWYEYRKIFINERRIQGGAAFWREHATTLARAEQTYGVPAEIVVAIIGVETQYGGNMGNYRVLEALATLAFDYPRRSAYFRKELENFLLLTRAEGVDPLTPRGSYAGAMGFGQFMPSSYRSYAVDFDGDGHRNLWTNPRDAIGSVAHYFAGHGWRPGEAIAAPATVSGTAYAGLISDKLSPPTRSVASLQAAGVRPQVAVNTAQPALLLKFAGSEGPEYWLGFANFYAITRYNHSQLYAMAVYQLAQDIRDRYQRASVAAPAPQARVD